MTSPGASRPTGMTVRSHLPVHAELEWIDCPCCGGREPEQLLDHDSFGFPIGLARCRACGFLFTNPRPTEPYMQSFYRDSYLAFYEGHKTFSDEYIREHRLDQAAEERLARYEQLVPSDGAVLDVGCGAGLFLAELRKRRPTVRVVGIEPGAAQARFARERFGIAVHEGVYQDFPDTTRFDLIVAFHVAEHLHDLPGFFAFCREHLAPHGHVVIESPNVAGDWAGMGFFHIAHVNAFTPQTLAFVASRHGFRVVRSATSERGWDKPNLHVVLQLGEADTIAVPVPLDDTIRERIAALPARRWFWIVKSWVKLSLHFAGLGLLLDRWRARRGRHA